MHHLITAAELRRMLDSKSPLWPRLQLRPRRHRAGERSYRRPPPRRVVRAPGPRSVGPRPAATAATRCPNARPSPRWMGRLGMSARVPPVVAYDRQGGMYAARAWWVLRWLGHPKWPCWTAGWPRRADRRRADHRPAHRLPPAPAIARPACHRSTPCTLLSSAERVRLIDARAGRALPRRGGAAGPVAGHIPGASNRFFKDNLQPDGRFKPAEQLRAEFSTCWRAVGRTVVQQCGSGVTACHNLLAMECGFGRHCALPRLVERMVQPTPRGPSPRVGPEATPAAS
jgi:thiosulfate/3-mercaptopyruvate sulfurtransferase